MKKNSLAIIMVLVLCVLACACGGSGSSGSSSVKASITDNDGDTVSMSSAELMDLYEENSAAYESKYKGAEASITGTVESVSTNMKSFGSATKSVYEIDLKEGWTITVLEEFHEEVIDLSAGDKITVTSNLQICFAGKVEMMHIGQQFGWYDDTIIEMAS